MMCSSYEKNNSQPCLEQQNEVVIANSCKYSALKQNNEDNLVNALLIKESEVSALKEVIDKWRTRALEAESVSSYYCEQFETMQAQYENEIIAIEEEYIHKLNEKDDIIFGLKQELHYFAGKASQNDSLEDLMDEFDNMSMMESVYDRNVEQSFTSFNNDSTPSYRQKMKSEDILDSIQDTVKAIEQELGIHLDTKPKYRRSLSASTLIEASPNETNVPTANDVLVPETLLKKNKANAKAAEVAAADKVAARKASIDTQTIFSSNTNQCLSQAKLVKRRELFKRAAKYHAEYKAAERKEITLRRQAKSNGNYYVPAQEKLVFVVRIRGINNIAPKPRKVLQLLRLLQINNGVFVRLNKATSEMLQLVQPYVTYGTPNLKTIRELIYKRGYAKVSKQRIPIHDNAVIEQALGKYGSQQLPLALQALQPQQHVEAT
ncbi:hypothetical protein G6F35_005424 [Rhizopus arrhizus]|nr:hypothetical protein G6F35_005424 [Rhizopus arrhizus]